MATTAAFAAFLISQVGQTPGQSKPAKCKTGVKSAFEASHEPTGMIAARFCTAPALRRFSVAGPTHVKAFLFFSHLACATLRRWNQVESTNRDNTQGPRASLSRG